MNSIEIRDNFLEEADAKRVLEYCFQSLYHYGECDMDDTPPTGMVHEIEEDEDIYRLFESKIKRSVEVKDASSLLPGHGGVLDRIDSQLLSFPVLVLLWLL